MKAERHTLRQRHDGNRSPAERLRVQHEQRAAVLVRLPDHGQQPAVALWAARGARHEHRLGRPLADAQGEKVPGAAIQVVAHDRVGPIHLADTEAVPVWQARPALVDAWELAGQLVQRFAPPRRPPGRIAPPAAEPGGRHTGRLAVGAGAPRAAPRSRRITPRKLPQAGSHAKGGRPAIARSRLPVSGSTGNTTCDAVTAKSCTMLQYGLSNSSSCDTRPLVSMAPQDMPRLNGPGLAGVAAA